MRLVSLALVVLATAGAGCGGTDDGAGPTPTRDTVVEATTTSTTLPTTTTTSLRETLTRTATVEAQDAFGGGYSARTVLRTTDALQRIESQSFGTTVIGAACSINAETDGVVPLSVELTNTTSGFSIVPAVKLNVQAAPTFWSNTPSMGISLEMHFDSGPLCSDFTGGSAGGFTINAGSDRAPSESVTAYGFLIVRNFYSPSYPEGNVTKLRDAVLTFEGANLEGGGRLVPRDGTGTVRLQSLGNLFAVPVDPSSDGGCLVNGDCAPGFSTGGL